MVRPQVVAGTERQNGSEEHREGKARGVMDGDQGLPEEEGQWFWGTQWV